MVFINLTLARSIYGSYLGSSLLFFTNFTFATLIPTYLPLCVCVWVCLARSSIFLPLPHCTSTYPYPTPRLLKARCIPPYPYTLLLFTLPLALPYPQAFWTFGDCLATTPTTHYYCIYSPLHPVVSCAHLLLSLQLVVGCLVGTVGMVWDRQDRTCTCSSAAFPFTCLCLYPPLPLYTHTCPYCVHFVVGW